MLSQTAEYALRAAAWMAAHEEDAPLRARDLSQEAEIPAHYLSKILRRLVLAGILVSQKGYGGGFTLARAPSEIRFMDVLAAVDAYPTEDRCLFGWGVCAFDQPCPLHEAWVGVSQAFRDWASSTTLADVQRQRLRARRSAAPEGGH